jgi:PAS domain S-box-containing protein
MRLRIKILSIMSLTTLALIIILYGFTQITILRTAIEMEKDATRQDVDRALNALSDELEEMLSITRDYASWDDTYAFVIDRNENYIETNLVDETFINLRLNLMLFIDKNGQIVFQKGFDLKEKKETSIPQGLLEHIDSNNPLVHHPNEQSTLAGIIILPRGPMIVTSAPILTSSYMGPIRGALIMGRYLDSDEISRLSQKTHLSINIVQINDSKLPTDFQTATLSTLVDRNEFVIRPLNENTVAGYALINDIYGKPALVLRVDLPRNTYNEAKRNIAYFIYSLVFSASAFAAAITLLVEKSIISRVTKLERMVDEIGKTGNMATRIPVTGRDEISSLTENVNNMLEQLEERQQQLVTERDKLDLVTQNLGAGLALISNSMKILWANKIWKKTFGDFEGKTCQEALKQSGEPCPRCGAQEIFEKGLDRVAYEQLRKDMDGNLIWLEVIATPLKDRDGRASAALELTVPITERKQMEEELRRHLEHLEELVEERTRKMLEYEKLAAVGETAMMIGHDLRNPLQVMMNIVYLAGEHLRSILPNVPDPDKANQIKGLCSSMEEQIEYMNKIVSDLQDFARPLQPRFQPTNLTQLIKDTVLTIRKPETVKISLNFKHEFPDLKIDGAMMRRALTNLITNAVQSMPRGGEITVTTSKRGKTALISVEDTGEGISKENLTKLFKPFFTTKAKGQGLGLPVTKRIVEAHGGVIKVKSKVGVGTTFTIELPIK